MTQQASPIAAAGTAIAARGMASLSRWRTFWRRHRHAGDVYAALRQLDSRTLRDLGLDRSEIASVAREVSGLAECQRMATLLSLPARKLR